jgi:hypothetical protein
MSAAAVAAVRIVNQSRLGWKARVRPFVSAEWQTSYQIATAVLGRLPTPPEWYRVSCALTQGMGVVRRWPELPDVTPWGTSLQEVRR